VFAEDGDISAEEQFDFGSVGRGFGEKPVTLQDIVDPGKPAALLKRIERTDTQSAFELTNQIKSSRSRAFGSVMTVGIGDASATLRIAATRGSMERRWVVRWTCCENLSAMNRQR